jgi:hypothetical protein
MLLERAARGGGEGRYRPGAGAEEVPGPETVDTALAQFLLGVRARGPGQRTGNTARPNRRVSEKELTEAILHRLELLAQRERRGAGKGKGKAGGKGRAKGAAQ